MYPGQGALNVEQVARVLGKTGTGGPQTIRNQIASNKFPLQKRLRRIGGRIVLPVAALADWLDGNDEDDNPVVPTVPSKRGKSSPTLSANPPARPRRGGRPPMILKDFVREFEAAWAAMLREPFDAENYEPKAPDKPSLRV